MNASLACVSCAARHLDFMVTDQSGNRIEEHELEKRCVPALPNIYPIIINNINIIT